MAKGTRAVVLGGGQAGARAAQALRSYASFEHITLIAGEPRLPYERPPLSKSVLTGRSPPEKAEIFALEFYRQHRIELEIGVLATGIDRFGRFVHLADGRCVPYDALLLATGARIRRLQVPGEDLIGVHYLRSLDDSLALGNALRRKCRLAIVGGGYIGLEVAASAREMGCEVSVLELGDSLMSRAVAPEVALLMQRYHEANGVKFHLNSEVAEIEGTHTVQGIRLHDGKKMAADAVVIGVGVEPETQIAQQAGLAIENGIVVDEQGRTSDPAIFAAGDVANHPNPLLGRRIRLESWQNAQNQAICVAGNMSGASAVYSEIPWFWSDQHDLNIQIVGLAKDWDEIVIRGDPDAKRFTAFYLKNESIICANAVNDARNIRPCRELISSGRRVLRNVLEDRNLPLRSLVDA